VSADRDIGELEAERLRAAKAELEARAAMWRAITKTIGDVVAEWRRQERERS
jgi:hypothetical protein